MSKKLMIALVALSCASVAHAKASPYGSHTVNIKPVRGFFENKLLDAQANKLKLTEKLDGKKLGAGITAAAAKKAYGSVGGYLGFQDPSGTAPGGVYVVKFGKEKLLVSTGGRFFSARTAKNGLVVARGNIANGKINWTRSHNRFRTSAPAERDGSR